jgi:hypothetical protein
MLDFASASVVLSANAPPIADDRVRTDASATFEIKLILASPDVKPTPAGYEPFFELSLLLLTAFGNTEPSTQCPRALKARALEAEA